MLDFIRRNQAASSPLICDWCGGLVHKGYPFFEIGRAEGKTSIAEVAVHPDCFEVIKAISGTLPILDKHWPPEPRARGCAKPFDPDCPDCIEGQEQQQKEKMHGLHE